ncbi:MAG TPA: phenylacetate--CoA ligase family protein [Candidatus Dormibacteraeota bacterium]|nr:phenylacetate--CoA ligase family protein [Candidatus Dormibacteraeota bacterium]
MSARVPAPATELDRQLAKLGRQLAYLRRRSPFYRRKLAEAGVSRLAVRTFEDLALLPFTTKGELRESQLEDPPLGSHAVADLRDVVRVHSSTGTTGQPSWVGLTRRDAAMWTDVVAGALATQGMVPEDVVVHGAGLSLFVGGLPVRDAVERIGATFVPIGTGASEKAVMALRSLGANALHSTPSYALYLAEYVAEKYGIDPRELGVTKVFVGGEPGGGEPATRALIERHWGARVTEGMGNADMAPIIFAECPAQAGMHHTAGDHVLVELIDPDTGARVPWEAGVTGELVYTATDRECCPLLRFRTGDRVQVLGVGCSCGRPGPRIRCIGRTDDMLIVLGVNVFPSAIRDVVSSLHPETTGAIQVLLPVPGPRVEPPLRVVAEYGQGATDLAALRATVQSLIRSRLTVPAEVELVPPDTLPRSEMKSRLVRRLYEADA